MACGRWLRRLSLIISFMQPYSWRNRRVLSMLPEKKAALTKGTVITPAVESLT
jgi:hypothetical protein